MLIGAHVSIASNLLNALSLTQKYQLNCLQIFSGPPRNWHSPHYSFQLLTDFRQLAQKLKIKAIFIHAKYLINLSSEYSLIQEKSINSLTEDLLFAHKIAARGVIFHPHAQNQLNLTKNIHQVLLQTPSKTELILENSAQIHLKALGLIIKTVASPRLKFCLDTAHLFEAGYDLNNQTICQKTFQEIGQEIGFKRWVAIHANNSQTPFNSHHDRHANITEGLLKPQVFVFFLTHPIAKTLPFILETPNNLQDTKRLLQLKTPSF